MRSAARTTEPAAASLRPALVFGRPLRRITVDQYHRMIDVDALHDGERCELIHGLIVEKRATRPPRASAVSKLMRLLMRMAGEAAAVRGGQPITLSDSEPEPDIVLASGTYDDYISAHPRARQVLLVVEVSDSSSADDRTTMLQLYAAERLPEYWIVNLVDHRIEVYTQPRGGKNPRYRDRADYGQGEEVPVVLSGTNFGLIAVADIFP